MQPYQVKTVFYRYQRMAALKLILYLFFALGSFFVVHKYPTLMVLWVVLVIIPPLVIAVRKKSMFNLREWDHRPLIITADYVQVGEEKFNFPDIQTIALYIDGFRDLPPGVSFQRRRNGVGILVSGDKNVLAFRHRGVTRSYEFFLRDFDTYVALCHIIDAWKNSGKSFVLKEQFSRDYIRNQLSNYR